MKGMQAYAAVMAIILGAFVYAEYHRPPKVDWRVTLSRFDRIPYGTWVLHQRLTDLFQTPATPVRTTFFDHLRHRDAHGEAYVVITRELKTGTADEAELLRYAARGNTVLLAAETFSETLADTLGFITDTRFSLDASDSTALRLVNPAFGPPHDYPMPRQAADTHFDTLDTRRSVVLGTTHRGRPDFIRIAVGRGQVLLHTAPRAFSNIAILRGEGHRYAEQALSYLPPRPAAMFWDDYYTIGLGGPTTPLRVILTRDNLRYAYRTALLAVALLLLFRSRRRQRAIPVIEPPRNTSLDFVDTVAQLYIDRADHRDIALKKIGFLLDQVRQRFGLPTGLLDEAFVRNLATRSGTDPREVRDLVRLIHDTRAARTLVAPELLRLSHTLDDFQTKIAP